MRHHLHIGILTFLPASIKSGFNANTRPCRTFAQLWLPACRLVRFGRSWQLATRSLLTSAPFCCLRGTSSRLQQQLPMTGLRRAPAPGAPEYRQPRENTQQQPRLCTRSTSGGAGGSMCVCEPFDLHFGSSVFGKHGAVSSAKPSPRCFLTDLFRAQHRHAAETTSCMSSE